MTTMNVPVVERPVREAEIPPAGEPYADVVETHTSVLFFIGGLVYKTKKPVSFPFLELSTPDARLQNCLRELSLNQVVAPDVYLGLSELRPMFLPGALGEPLIVMRRMPRSRRLSTLVRSGADVRGHLSDIARQLAALHAREHPAESYGLASTMADLWHEGREQLEPFAHEVLPAAELDAVAALAAEYLAGRRGMLERRERAGLVRPGHGDLLAEDIFCLDDGVRLLDCLEFDERLRTGDTLLDAAFLTMDLEALGDPAAGRWFLDRYREVAGIERAEGRVEERVAAPRSLEDHYIGYRAFVRAKVACLRHAQGGPHSAATARAMLRQCRRHLDAGRVQLVLLGGLPGAGKSAVAEAVVADDPQAREWCVLSTDRVRKELAGRAPEDDCAAPYGEGIYSPDWTETTYDELLRRAETALRAGVNVVLDGSWGLARHRARARRLARAASAALTEIRCVAPLPVCTLRLEQRPHRVSDADASVLRAMAEQADPWPQSRPLQTTSTPTVAAAAVHALLATAPLPR